MRILLFGRNGQVAQCLQQEARGVHQLTALGRAEADLMRAGTAASAIERTRPELVVNAAAYTAVDKAEEEPAAAQQLNAAAPAEMAAATRKTGARFIHLSTDYVFDGNDERALSEDHETAPLNVYGRTKREGENAVLTADDRAVILRTSWVFSEFGGNFVKTMLRLGAERSALSIVDDQVGGPTAARDIAKAVLTIGGKIGRCAPGAGVYHYQGAPSVSWAGFARRIFDAAGVKVAVEPIATADYPTPARRPLRTVLDCARIERDFGLAQPDWRAALHPVVAMLTTGRQ